MENGFLFLNKKKVYSVLSYRLVTFVETLKEVTPDMDCAFSDGINLMDIIDGIINEDDISRMFFEFKDGISENCEDFYSEHGAYDENSTFIEDIKALVADR